MKLIDADRLKERVLRMARPINYADDEDGAYDRGFNRGLYAASKEVDEAPIIFNAPLPCKPGDILYEIDLPVFGIIVCRVIWVNYYNGPYARNQHNEMVTSFDAFVDVIEGHGKGSSYTFTSGDFGVSVFPDREQAENELKRRKNL